MEWLRLYHGTATDPKWRLIAARADDTVALVLSVWVLMLEHGNQAGERGSLASWSDDVAAAAFDVGPERIHAIRKAMEGVVLSGPMITHFEKRQFFDYSTPRVQAWRARKRDETDCNDVKRSETHVTPEQNRTDRTEQIESKRASLPAPPTINGSGKKVAAEKVARGSRLTIETLPDDWRAECLADRPDLDPAWTWKCFVDYWLARPGKDGRKLDWLRTWRNWYRAQRPPPNQAQAIVEKPLSYYENLGRSPTK